MRLIDADALMLELGEEPPVWYGEDTEVQERNDHRRYKALIDAQPTVDAVEVVRCENCIYRGIEHEDLDYCYQDKRWHLPWDYCSCGVRKE